jgi:phosphohistidine swiveling domain-containing protein
MTEQDWPAPGPGLWIRLADHFDRPWTAEYERIFAPTFVEGSLAWSVPYGLPVKMGVQTVHGYPFIHAAPLAGPDLTRPMPKPLVWLLARAVPALRRCEKNAAKTLQERPWRASAQRWWHHDRDAAITENRALSNVDVARLPDLELARHLEECEALVFAGYREHFELHGTDLLPVGVYLDACKEWGIETEVALDLVVEGASDMRRSNLDPEDLAHCVVGGYDLDRPRFCELPPEVIERLATASAPSFASRLDRVDDIVPPEHREAFDILLGDARTVFPVRDDNGVVLGAWRIGLLRRAFLEIGHRLHDKDVIEATVPELVAALGARAPLPALAERAAERARWARVDAPLRVGTGVVPDISMLPPAMRRIAAGQLTLGDMIERDHMGDLEGLGIGDQPAGGIARVVSDADDAIMRLEPGDVLVVRVTSPAFNVVLPLVSAIVTEHGGAMSHAAIVARELGVPAIVGVKDATRRIRDGERIHVDPGSGRVVVVDAQLAPKSVTP